MQLSEMKSAERVLADQLKNPTFREEWDRTALSRAVATRVVAYRAQTDYHKQTWPMNSASASRLSLALRPASTSRP